MTREKKEQFPGYPFVYVIVWSFWPLLWKLHEILIHQAHFFFNSIHFFALIILECLPISFIHFIETFLFIQNKKSFHSISVQCTYTEQWAIHFIKYMFFLIKMSHIDLDLASNLIIKKVQKICSTHKQADDCWVFYHLAVISCCLSKYRFN